MKIEDAVQLDFDDVLIKPNISDLNSRSEVCLLRNIGYGGYVRDSRGKKCWKNNLVCIPITCANMATVGNTECVMKLVINDYIGTLDKHISEDNIKKLYDDLYELANSLDGDNKYLFDYSELRSRVSISIGIRETTDIIKNLSKNKDYCPNIVTIDVPNGYCPKLLDRIKEVRDILPDSFIVAGNVVTAERVYSILNSGADCAKVGIGSSGICLTRAKTGVGRPQLSTIIDCADAAHHLNKYIMSDGGCKVVGDICKAFCAGADFVMTGSMFAGCDESTGDIVTKNNKLYKEYYGMSSKLAQERHFGGFKSNVRASEGREKLVPYKGPIKNIIEDINGGLRSTATYIGCHRIENLSKHTTFYRVNRQLNTIFESCPDITT